MINGQPMRISAWIKEGKSGKFMSLRFEEPRMERPRGEPQSAPDFEDTIPF